MRPVQLLGISLMIGLAFPLAAQEETGPVSRSLEDRAKRGTLVDRFEKVRGDAGKWRDEARLQVSPPVSGKREKASIDDWADSLDLKNIRLSKERDTWLIFRTQQLDDNDRLWIEKIERKGNRITVVLNHAVWQGYYSKNFTWYGVYAVNLGKLPSGDYEADWVVEPLTFQEFEDPAKRRTSWPKDDRPAEDGEPDSLSVSFSVSQ